MKLRPFELVLVVIFIILAVLALILLSTYRSSQNAEEVLIGDVLVWGTLDGTAMSQLLAEIIAADETYSDVRYRQISRDSFAQELTNALADGQGPDLLLVSHEQLVELRRRIIPISYESFPLRDFRTAYIDGAEIFALSDGLYAYPVAVDPLMLYWNRDILTNQGFLSAPRTWEEVVNTYTQQLTTQNFDRSISRSAVAFGDYGNVTNAFGVLSLLLIQSGSERVLESDGRYTVNLNRTAAGTQPLVTTLDFYTRFAKPNNSLYSWNRALPNDRQAFIAEDLALYFGFGSEADDLERANPNLNFDIAEVPQGATATVRRTYGQFYGLALARGTDNPRGASIVLSTLAGAVRAEQIAKDNQLAPVHRSTLSRGSTGTYEAVYYQSAPITFGWLNPARPTSDSIFSQAVRDVVEGRADESSAAGDVLGRLEIAYN